MAREGCTDVKKVLFKLRGMQTNIETWNKSDLTDSKEGLGELGTEQVELGRDCQAAFLLMQPSFLDGLLRRQADTPGTGEETDTVQFTPWNHARLQLCSPPHNVDITLEGSYWGLAVLEERDGWTENRPGGKPEGEKGKFYQPLFGPF